MNSYKNKSGIIHLLPLVLVGVLLIGGLGAAYYFGKNSNTPLLTKSSPEPDAMMEEEIPARQELEQDATVDASDWEVYTNGTYSFKYPKYLEIESTDSILSVTDTRHPRSDPVPESDAGNRVIDGVYFTVESTNLNGQTFTQWYEQILNRGFLIWSDFKPELIKVESTTYSGYEFPFNFGENHQNFVLESKINSNNAVFIANSSKDTETFDQIVSTFKFTK